MVNEVEFSSMATGDSPRPSTAMEILLEAAKTLAKGRKVIVSFFFIFLVLDTLLLFCNYYSTTPLMLDMVTKYLSMQTKDRNSREYTKLLAAIMKDLLEYTTAEVIVIVISKILGCLFVAVVIYASAMAYSGKQLTLKDLFLRIIRTWKGPLVTQLYVVVMGLGYNLLLVAPIVVLVLATINSMIVGALGALLVLLALIFMYIYLQLIWSLGMVVSVVEEDCYGLVALGKAAVLIRGRKKLGFVVNFYLFLFIFIIFGAFQFVNTSFAKNQTVQLASGYIMVCLMLLVGVFNCAVYTVFHYECKKSHGGQVSAKEGVEYTILDSSLSAIDEEAFSKV